MLHSPQPHLCHILCHPYPLCLPSMVGKWCARTKSHLGFICLEVSNLNVCITKIKGNYPVSHGQRVLEWILSSPGNSPVCEVSLPSCSPHFPRLQSQLGPLDPPLHTQFSDPLDLAPYQPHTDPLTTGHPHPCALAEPTWTDGRCL